MNIQFILNRGLKNIHFIFDECEGLRNSKIYMSVISNIKGIVFSHFSGTTSSCRGRDSTCDTVTPSWSTAGSSDAD